MEEARGEREERGGKRWWPGAPPRKPSSGIGGLHFQMNKTLVFFLHCVRDVKICVDSLGLFRKIYFFPTFLLTFWLILVLSQFVE